MIWAHKKIALFLDADIKYRWSQDQAQAQAQAQAQDQAQDQA
jgi:hypothetical protein